MVNFTLHVHLAKLKLLVPLHSSNHKLYIKITGMDEAKTVQVPQITNEMITKQNGVIHIHEDIEFKLNQGCNKLSVSVYATKTFKEDILLFINDVSLRKPLTSESIVKLETKLFNIDKVQVAVIYLEMQRKGAVMPSNDFMSDLTQRLNLESTKVVKRHERPRESEQTPREEPSKASGFFSSFKSKPADNSSQRLTKQKSIDKKKIAMSSLEITQQVFGIPQFGFNVQGQREKAIPGFDPLLLGDNFQRFLKSIDGLVSIYEYVFSIFTLHNTKESCMFLTYLSIAIINFEQFINFSQAYRLVLTMLPFGLVIFIFYNFYFKNEFKRPEMDVLKNMRFIQMIMGYTSDLIQLTYEFIEDFLYWKQPDKAQILIKDSLKLPICIFIGMYYISIRYFIVLGIWCLALSQSQFCVTLVTLIAQKAIESAETLNVKVIQEFILRKKNKIANFQISLPFSSVISSLRAKFKKNAKNRPKYERQMEIEDDDSVGEEISHVEKAFRTEQNQRNSPPELKTIQVGSLDEKSRNIVQKAIKTDRESLNKVSLMSLNKNSLDVIQRQPVRSASQNLRTVKIPAQDQFESQDKRDTVLQDEFNSDQDEIFHEFDNDQQDEDGGYEEDLDTPMPDFHYDDLNSKAKANGIHRKVFVTYENQRWWLSQWTGALLPGERNNWSDMNGDLNLPKETFKLPGKDWMWEDIWHVDKHPEFNDEEGWSYGVDFASPFHKHQGLFDVVRKRKWVRICKQKEYTTPESNISTRLLTPVRNQRQHRD